MYGPAGWAHEPLSQWADVYAHVHGEGVGGIKGAATFGTAWCWQAAKGVAAFPACADFFMLGIRRRVHHRMLT